MYADTLTDTGTNSIILTLRGNFISNIKERINPEYTIGVTQAIIVIIAVAPGAAVSAAG